MKPTPRYTDYLQLTVVIAVFILLFSHTLVNLIHDWQHDDNYSHGFLIPFISGYMIYQKKKELVTLAPEPDHAGLLFILMGMCFHVVGNLGSELFTMRMAIIVTLYGLIRYFWGRRMTRQLNIPIAYLIFMIPIPAIIWNKIAFPLQLFAARLTASAVRLTGIPIFREGNILKIPSTTLEVIDACSGLRSLTSLLALSAAFAYIMQLSRFKKWILFLSAIPIAIACNVGRLTLTAIMVEMVGPEMEHLLHEYSGFLVFGMAFVLLFIIQHLLKKIDDQKTTALSA